MFGGIGGSYNPTGNDLDSEAFMIPAGELQLTESNYVPSYNSYNSRSYVFDPTFDSMQIEWNAFNTGDGTVKVDNRFVISLQRSADADAWMQVSLFTTLGQGA